MIRLRSREGSIQRPLNLDAAPPMFVVGTWLSEFSTAFADVRPVKHSIHSTLFETISDDKPGKRVRTHCGQVKCFLNLVR